MNPLEILARHHDPAGSIFELLVTHSTLVAAKAREIARHWASRHPGESPDLDFLTEAAMLHDIGIGLCEAPQLHCKGTEPYLAHGILGRQLLEKEGLKLHALVCERHTGAGITAEEIREGGLPLPERDYLPVSLEEKIICVADKFYSKKPGKLWKEKKTSAIEDAMDRWGPIVRGRWDELAAEFLSDD
ncbi:MAG: HD domain-containing protein [Planctomycetota bacterium]|nr:HD domain-containing protein [Planctomycetota bacterium]MEE3199935.1 HD domain-containing protein [Planctomycetota bacterium]